MNRNRNLIVFDFETDGKFADSCNIVEIAAIPIDLRNLNILEDDIFELVVRPKELGGEGYYEAHEDTINWHAEQRQVSPQEVYANWENGVPEKEAWSLFAEYIEGYSTGTKWDSMPIPGGQNIRGFDMPIVDRYADRYKKKLKFNKRDVIDLMDVSRIWMLFVPEAPDSIGLEALRTFFGLAHAGAHTARQDVLDTCHFINKFLGLHSRIAPRIVWNAESTQKV